MKIILFTQEDPFYVKIFFEEFLNNYKNINEIRAVVISKAMGKKTIFGLMKQMFGFYGFLYFTVVGFKYAFYKIMNYNMINKVKFVKGKKTYSVKQTVIKFNIPVIERNDINSDGFMDLIKNYDADLFISIASPIIFKRGLIDIPKIDCINIHNAPLPYYRGMLPNFWQLYNEEKESGITIHRIDKDIDTGDIIEQCYLPIRDNESLHELIVKTKKENAKMILNIIEAFRFNNVTYTKIKGNGSYFTFPKRKHVKIFKKKGKKLF